MLYYLRDTGLIQITHITQILVVSSSSAIAKNTLGYMPRLAESVFSNIKASGNLINGIYSNDAWMISWAVSADPKVILGAQTLSCWGM